MSGPDEHPSMAASLPDTDLRSRLRGESPGKKSSATKSLNERLKGKNATSPARAPPRVSSNILSPSEIQLGPGEILESSSNMEMNQLSDGYVEVPAQIVGSGHEETMSMSESTLNASIEEALAASVKLEDSKKECRRLRDQVAELHQKLGDSRNDCKQLQDQIVALQKQFDDAAGFVFSLQRREQKITETEAAAEYKTLYDMVENWVQSTLGDAIEQKFAEKSHPTNTKTKEFLTFIPQPGKEAFRYPDTDEYNIIAAIMRFLCIEIFEKDFYCPIGRGWMDFVISTEKSMRNLNPPRDHITLRSWRSETLTAITHRQDFVKHRQSHSDKLSEDLAHMLHVFHPRSDSQGFRHSVQVIIIEPALKLAHKMHLSVDQFTVRYSSFHRVKREDRGPLSRDSCPFECIMLSPLGKVLNFPVQEGILTYLFDVSPELVFEEAKTASFGEPRVLKRGRVLVAKTKEERGPYTGPSPRPREPPTLLALLNEAVHGRQASNVGKRGAFSSSNRHN